MATHMSGYAAWTAASFPRGDEFVTTFDADDRRQLVDAVGAWRAAGPAAIESLTRDDTPLGGLEAKLATLYDEIRAGRGFVVMRGLPTEDLSLEDFTAIVWTIGLRFGQALSQSAAGERIGQVIDATAEDPTPRMFRSNLELRAHNDITAMLSLACWNAAASGGESILVSGVTVHDEIARRAPHLLENLYRGYHYHRMGEEGPDEEESTPFRVPVFANVDGDLSVRYQRTGIAAGQRAVGEALTEADIEALNLFDEIAAAPENRVAFTLGRGDMMVINNYTLLHARRRFTNFPEEDRKRLLVRLWFDTPGFRKVPRAFNHFSANGIPFQEGRRCTFDFKQLYADDPVGTGGVPKLDLETARPR